MIESIQISRADSMNCSKFVDNYILLSKTSVLCESRNTEVFCDLYLKNQNPTDIYYKIIGGSYGNSSISFYDLSHYEVAYNSRAFASH